MALRDYATDVLGSKARLRVLKTLIRYKAKIFTIRELARTAGLSHPETSKIIKELELKGVVKLQPIGSAIQVSLNEESYILKSVVEPLFRAEKKTLDFLLSAMRPFFRGRRIFSVAIFGSVAKGLEKDTSDVDLLVVAEDEEYAITCVSRANEAIISKFGFTLSPLIMTKARFVQGRNTDLEKSILESHMMVCGKNLEVIKNVKTTR